MKETLSVVLVKSWKSLQDALIGRVVNPLGQPVDGLGEIVTDKFRQLKHQLLVLCNKSVSEPLQTGLKAIDALVPIGRSPSRY